VRFSEEIYQKLAKRLRPDGHAKIVLGAHATEEFRFY